MDWTSISVLVVVAVVLSNLGSMIKPARGREKLRRIPMMTANELEFWKLLVPAASPLHVGPQVAMGALLDADTGLTRSGRTATRNRFDRQRVDFVLFDDRGAVRLLVELDDSTHRPAKDAERDRRTSSVGYRTLRLKRRDARSVEALRALLNHN